MLSGLMRRERAIRDALLEKTKQNAKLMPFDNLSKEERPLVLDCVFAFVASAIVTAIVCVATPGRPLPEYCRLKGVET